MRPGPCPPTFRLTIPAALPRSPQRAGEHHIDIAATACRAREALFPVEHRHVGAVARGHVRCVWLDLTPTCLAPDNDADAGRCRAAERCRRARVGVHS